MTSKVSVEGRKISIDLVKRDEVRKFKMQIDFPKAQLSGMLIAKNQNDTIRGAFVNEFGIKAFEFYIVGKEGAVSTQIKALNKWYIRRTLSADLAFIFSPEGQWRWLKPMDELEKTAKIERIYKGKTTGELTVVNDSLVTMLNVKRNITYQLKMIK